MVPVHPLDPPELESQGLNPRYTRCPGVGTVVLQEQGVGLVHLVLETYLLHPVKTIFRGRPVGLLLCIDQVKGGKYF